ncbi:MAG: hypothetical protein ABIC19_02175 [Patescibacteria group bacterium]
MDNNYWYYILSAIPQTLAAMIALSATFFVFRLNSISEDIKKIRANLLRFAVLLKPNSLGEVDIIERKTDEEFFEIFKRALKKLKTGKSYLGLDEKIYKKIKSAMNRIIKEEWHGYSFPKSGKIIDYLEVKVKYFESLSSTKEMIKHLFGWSLFSAVSMIVLSLLALPLRNLFCDLQSYLVIGVMLLGSLAAIIYTAYSVWKIATVVTRPQIFQ